MNMRELINIMEGRIPLAERLDKQTTLDRLGDALKERVKEDHSAKSPEAVFDLVVKHDPTPNQQYGKWMLDRYIRKGIRYAEDFARAGEALAVFEKQKNKPYVEGGPNLRTKEAKPDINRIKSLSELETLVEPFLEVKTKSELKAEINSQTEVVYDGPEGKIVVPKTEAASCFWGQGTKWCTAAENNNMFDHYSEDGRLYIVMMRDGRKYQLHFESGQFMDERDDDIEDILEFFGENEWIWKSIFSTPEAFVQAYPPVYGIIGGDVISKLPEDAQYEIIRRHPAAIKFIDNPSEKIQLEAIERNAWLLGSIKNPTDATILRAIQSNTDVMEYINDPSDELQMKAVQLRPQSIQYIKNPTKEVQLYAVSHDWAAIGYIKNPSMDLKIAAIKGNGSSIGYIDNPSEKLQLLAVENSAWAIRQIKNPTQKVLDLNKKLWGSGPRW